MAQWIKCLLSNCEDTLHLSRSCVCPCLPVMPKHKNFMGGASTEIGRARELSGHPMFHKQWGHCSVGGPISKVRQRATKASILDWTLTPIHAITHESQLHILTQKEKHFLYFSLKVIFKTPKREQLQIFGFWLLLRWHLSVEATMKSGLKFSALENMAWKARHLNSMCHFLYS